MSAIALDLETTDIDKDTAKIVEIAIVDVDDDSRFFRSLINPGIPIPPGATEVHGIHDHHVEDAPDFAYVIPVTANFIENADAVIGYNIFYDQQILDREFRAAGRDVKWPPLVCAKRVWDTYEPRPPRSLVDAYQRFVHPDGGHEWSAGTNWICAHCGQHQSTWVEGDTCPARKLKGAHGALADTRYVIQVIKEQIKAFGLEDKEWWELDPESSSWWGPTKHIIWSDQRDALFVNFGKNKDTTVLSVPKGYWRWLVGTDFPRHVKGLAHFIIDCNPSNQELIEFAERFF